MTSVSAFKHLVDGLFNLHDQPAILPATHYLLIYCVQTLTSNSQFPKSKIRHASDRRFFTNKSSINDSPQAPTQVSLPSNVPNSQNDMLFNERHGTQHNATITVWGVIGI